MAGGAGTEIGTVYVKVTPDTRGFRREAETGIKSEMAGVEGEAKVNPDTKGFREKVRATTANLPEGKVKVTPEVDGSELDRFQRRMLSRLSSAVSKIELGIELDAEGERVRREITKLESQIAQRIRLKIPMDFEEASAVRTRVQKLVQEAERTALTIKPIEVKLKFDEGFADRVSHRLEKARLAEAEKRIKETTRLELAAAAKRAEYDAFLDETGARESLIRWRLMLADMAGRDNIDVKLRVIEDENKWNPHMVRRRIQAFFTGNPVKVPLEFDDKGIKKPPKLPKASDFSDFLPNFGSGINPAGYVAILAGITLVAAPLIGLITTALLTLPGLISLVATPIAAITLGLEGFKKAAQSIEEPFKALRAEMDKAVESQFTPVFEQLAKGFPLLERSMPKVSQGLADIAGEVARFVTEGEGARRIEATIGNIGAAFTNASPGVRDFVDGFTYLAEQFSLELPDLVAWFNEQGAAFKDWVMGLDLEQAFDTLGTVLDEILSTLGELAMSGMDFVSDPGAVDAFVASLKSLLGVIEDIGDASAAMKPVWEAFGVVGDLGQVIRGDWNGIRDLLERGGLSDEWLGGFLASDSGQAGEKGREIGSQLAKGIQEGIDAGLEIGTDALNMDKLGPAVQAQIDQMQKNAGVSAEDFKTALKSAFTPDAVDSAVRNQLQTQVESAIQGAQAALQSMGPDLQAAIDEGLMPLLGLSDRIAAVVGPAFEQIRQGTIATFALMVLSIGQQATNIETVIRGAFENIPGVISTALGTAVQTAATGGNQIVVGFTTPLTQMSGVVLTIFNNLVTVVQTSMSSIVTEVAKAGEQIGAAIRGWAGMIEAASADMAGVARAGGAAVGSAFAAGIVSMQGAVSSAVAGMMGAARGFFPNSPAEKGPFSGSGWVDKSGEAIGVSFADGIGSTQAQVVDTVRQMMQAIKDVFGDASGLTLNFNFGGLPATMGSMASSAKEFQSSMIDSANPAKALNAEGKAQLEDLKQRLALLEIERKSLMEQKYAGVAPEEEAMLDARIKEIQALKNSLGLQRDQLAYAEKYGGVVSDTADLYGEQFQTMAQMPLDFARTNVTGMLQDFGVSGNGMLSNLANIGLDYGSKFIFNVSNIDEAMAVQRNQVNKQGMGVLPR